MSSKKTLTILPVILLMVTSGILPNLLSVTASATPSQGKTTFYFTDMLSSESDFFGFNYEGFFVPLSQTPPTRDNTSFYPPRILGFGPSDTKDMTTWFSYWLIYLVGIGDFGDIDGFEDLFGGIEFLLPHPLRIVQSYDYTGNETIYLNGDISFDIFMTTQLLSRINKNDRIKVGLHLFNPNSLALEDIGSENLTVSPSLLQANQFQEIIIEDINASLRPNRSLLCSIELIPGNKTITTLLGRESPLIRSLVNGTIDIIDRIAERSNNDNLQDLVFFYEEIMNLTQDSNITKQDIIDIVNAVISTSIMYDSAEYPSSVTVPFSAEPSEDGTSNNYYLHSGSNMDTNSPTDDEFESSSLFDGSFTWSSSSFSRNKIISNVSALVYIAHKDYRFLSDSMTVVAFLSLNDEIVASDSHTLDKTFALVQSIKPYRFSFSIPEDERELEYENTIDLTIRLQNDSDGNAGLLQSCDVYYDANQYKSSVSLIVSETDHITSDISLTPEDAKIIVGDKVIYTIEVSSERVDNISVSIRPSTLLQSEKNNWSVSITPSSFNINQGGSQIVTVEINSLATTLHAYDNDPFSAVLEIVGLTGIDTVPITAEVSEEAVTYDFHIQSPLNQEIVKGEQYTYQFTVTNNNTGLWPDRYIFSAVSEEDQNISINPLQSQDIAVGNSTTINVTITVPEDTEVDEDSLTFTVVSKESGLTKNTIVNTTIVGANILESFFDYFDTLAKDLGLDSIAGEYAPHLLGAIILIIVFFMLIVVVFILTTKYVDIICLDRIKHIDPTDKAIFHLIIKNPTKKLHTYNISTHMDDNPLKWKMLDHPSKLILQPLQQQEIQIIARSLEDVEPSDWAEIQVTVGLDDMKKQKTIPLLVAIKHGTPELEIDKVFHWPRSFSTEEKVSTSFRLSNIGRFFAKEITVILKVNGKEKNIVQDINIPPGGYADITLPWIAEKDKNSIRITVLQ